MSSKEQDIPMCKVVHATAEDFLDFQAFVNRMEDDPEVKKSGIVKVRRPLAGHPSARLASHLGELRGRLQRLGGAQPDRAELLVQE